MAHARTISRYSGHYHSHHAHLRPQEEKQGIDWGAAGWAGLIAGMIFLLLETALITMFIGGPTTDAVRRIAAIALGQPTLPRSSPFTALVFTAAMAVHLPLSLLYARALAPLINGAGPARAACIGAAFGGFLYALNYYVFTGIFPWFAAARGWMTLTSHVVFGVVAATAYVMLTEREA